ncbi:type II secretion system F family protein [Pseudarthrobacter sp. Y6]|jgi:tight adherence protein B|uniref:type II secretion system F family protein n=1 Tax=Pseudarthrobacter sp. Y6 TaxID=3418422 RepID=UPI003CF6E1D0
MNTILAILCALGIGFGILWIILEFTRTPGQSRPTSNRLSPWARLRQRLGPGQALALVLGIAGGLLLFARTGWLVTLVAVPAAALLLPPLFSTSKQIKEIAQLEALESWARSLSGLLGTGSTTLTGAVVSSLPNAPEAIRPQLNNLVVRLNSRWSHKRAFKALANELNDPTADLLAAHLILASKIKVSGLQDALDDLAQTIFEEIRQRREIDAARETNRTTAKWVTIFTVGAMVAAATFLADFFSVYQTPIGQGILTLIIGAYAVALKWMHSLTKPDLPPRILVDSEGARA